jgi:hypothetical protein
MRYFRYTIFLYGQFCTHLPLRRENDMKLARVLLLAVMALVVAETMQDAHAAPPPCCPPICKK